MRKLTAALLCAALLMCSGCMSFVERDYVSESAHKPQTALPPEKKGPVTEVSDYVQLRAAIEELVKAHEELGTIRISGYSDSIEDDVSSACMDIANNTPFGAYAVYYITSSVSKIVSYYEAEISITYKKSAEQMESVVRVEDYDSLLAALKSALKDGNSSLAVLANVSFASDGGIADMVDSLYYGDPSVSAVYPKTSVSVYPQTGTDKIFDVTFSYVYLRSSLLSMREKLLVAADEQAEAVKGLDARGKLCAFAECLAGVTAVEKDWSGGDSYARNTDDTAYGALVRGSASSEGVAMAVKLLCDRTETECRTVLGRRGGTDCGWNIVCLDGVWYHVDVFRFISDGLTGIFLKNDADMSEEYLWDTAKLPVCTGETEYLTV